MTDNVLRWEQRQQNYRKALGRLAAVIQLGKSKELDEFERDSMVKRFEFSFECAWRVMKSYSEAQGETEIGASRDSIRRAFQLNLIEEPDIWMDMIKWRNETSHNYDGEVAEAAIANIRDEFFPLMRKFCAKMDSRSTITPQNLFPEEK